VIDVFKGNTKSEKFFLKMQLIIQKEIDQQLILDHSKEARGLINKVLRLLQLFCENHNNDLQNYLRDQTTSKNNHDLVTMCVKLLCSYKKRTQANIDSILQAFNTLTEFIQVHAVSFVYLSLGALQAEPALYRE
jgi:hypothetical protein